MVPFWNFWVRVGERESTSEGRRESQKPSKIASVKKEQPY